MFSLFWNLSAALNGYMRFYMPTNRAVDWLRTPRGLEWAVPVALVATPAYLFAMRVCATLIERGAPGYFNVLVLLFAWNAMKFAAMGLVCGCHSLMCAARCLVVAAARHGRVS
jgi:hypothetical protein